MRAVASSQFGKDVVDMGFDRRLTYNEFCGNLAVAAPTACACHRDYAGSLELGVVSQQPLEEYLCPNTAPGIITAGGMTCRRPIP